MPQTALILGSSGRFGRHAATAFETSGWRVRRFDRQTGTLLQAAQGADVIVNAWNPAYPDWAAQVPGLHADVIEAAKHSRACVIVPGNVYVFGAQTAAPWSPSSPHAAQNPLGRVRIAMEQQYRDAGVQTIVLRAGDFLDTCASGNWFDKVLIKSLGRGVLTYPGQADVPHSWAFLPDLCRAAVELADRRATLPTFSDVPFAGYTLTGNDLARALAEVIGRPVRVKPLSWLPLRLLAPIWPMGRCLVEMRYLWDTPHWLDDTALNTLLPGFQPTPLTRALAQAVHGVDGTNRSTQTNRWRLADKAAS